MVTGRNAPFGASWEATNKQPDRAERMKDMKKYQIIYMKNGRTVTKWARTIEQVDKSMEKLISAGYAPSVWPNPHPMRAGW